jgi:hypothetical protein
LTNRRHERVEKRVAKMLKEKTVSKAQVMEVVTNIIKDQEKSLNRMRIEYGDYYNIIQAKKDLSLLSDLRIRLFKELNEDQEINSFTIFSIKYDMEDYYIELANSYNIGSQIESKAKNKLNSLNKFYWEVIEKFW